MKKILTVFLALVLCGVTQAKPPEESLILLVGNTPEAWQMAESMKAKMGDSYPQLKIIAHDSEEGQKFQASDETSYLFRKVGDTIVWQRSLREVESAWTDFQSTTYDMDEDKLVAWTQVVPDSSPTPLRQYDVIEFYMGGRPDLQVQAMVGGAVLQLTEERPGYYTGGYRVQAEDRVEATLRVTAQDQTGMVETLELGQLALEGLQTPRVTAMGQITTRQWVFEGEGPPSTNLELAIEIRRGTLFGKRTKRRKVTAATDADGKFRAVAKLGPLSSSPRGIVKVKAIDQDGVELQGEEQEVRFQSRVRLRPAFYGGWGWNSPFYRRGFLRGGCY